MTSLPLNDNCVDDDVIVSINRLFYWIESFILFANKKEFLEFYFKLYNSLLREKKKVSIFVQLVL